MLCIPGTGTVPEARDLTTFSKFSESITETNKCKLGPAITLVASGVLIILSIWAIIMILFARPNPREEQAADQMLAQPENQHYDQRPMMFAMGSVMLQLTYLILLEPELAYRLTLFLRLAGIIYMGSLALYLNPETMISHYWIVYLLGSSIGPTLLLIYFTSQIKPGRLEIFMFLSFGLSALFMKPLIILSQSLNQSLQPHGKQPHEVSEPDQIPQDPLPIERPENKRATPNVPSEGENARKSSKSTNKHSKRQPRDDSGVRAAQREKYKRMAQIFTS
jgi:hypothetical protein